MPIDKLLSESLFQSGQLLVKLCGNAVANLLVELVNTLAVLKPQLTINVEQTLERIDGDIQTVKIDILGIGDVTDRRPPTLIRFARSILELPRRNTAFPSLSQSHILEIWMQQTWKQ